MLSSVFVLAVAQQTKFSLSSPPNKFFTRSTANDCHHGAFTAKVAASLAQTEMGVANHS